jgi:hypothetical protein
MMRRGPREESIMESDNRHGLRKSASQFGQQLAVFLRSSSLRRNRLQKWIVGLARILLCASVSRDAKLSNYLES